MLSYTFIYYSFFILPCIASNLRLSVIAYSKNNLFQTIEKAECPRQIKSTQVLSVQTNIKPGLNQNFVNIVFTEFDVL